MRFLSPATNHLSGIAPAAGDAVSHPPFLVAVFFLVNLLLGSVSFGEGLYLSQFTLIAFLAIMLVARGKGRMLAPLVWTVAALCILFATAYVAGGPEQERFLPEFFKTALLILGGLILWGELNWRDLRAAAIVMPPVVLGISIVILALGEGDYYGSEGRFGVPAWGSPNTTAFVLCIAVVLWLYEMQQRLGGIRHSADRGIVMGLQGLVLAGLVAFIAYTASAGGILTLAVILTRYAGIRLRAIMFAVPFLVGAVWVLGIELPELIGSGRPIIWATLLEAQYSSTFDHWLVGFGPGSIDLRPWFTARVLSAHSMYIEVLYNWGVIATALMIFALIRFSRRLQAADLGPAQRLFGEALFASLVAGFLVDTYLLSAQLSWLGAFILGLGGMAARKT